MKSPIPKLVLIASLFLLAACQPAGPPPLTIGRSLGGLAFDIGGEGPVVVLIHGSNLDRRMWNHEVEWLRQDARVLRYDLRGQGESDPPEVAYANHADLIALLDELHLDQVTLIGLSAGAQVALDAALAAPDRVKSLVLVSPSLTGYVPEEMPPFFADLMSALKAQDYAAANAVMLASPVMSVPPESAALVKTMVEDNSRLWTIPWSLVEQMSPPAIERLDQVRVPVLILVGSDDMAAIHAIGRILEHDIGDAQRVTIPGGGHLLNLTSPGPFRDAVSVFLEQTRQ